MPIQSHRGQAGTIGLSGCLGGKGADEGGREERSPRVLACGPSISRSLPQPRFFVSSSDHASARLPHNTRKLIRHYIPHSAPPIYDEYEFTFSIQPQTEIPDLHLRGVVVKGMRQRVAERD